jgi:predicted metalloenzyme YecM
MFQNLEPVFQQYDTFIDNNLVRLIQKNESFFYNFCALIGINKNLEALKFLVTHIGYRCISSDNYDRKKTELADTNLDLLSEIEIGGRSISTWKHQSETFTNRSPFILELIAPKPTNQYSEGLQIVALLLPTQDRETLNRLALISPDLFDTSGLDNKLNPHVEIPLDNGNVVKFHIRSLEDVIAIEKSQ